MRTRPHLSRTAGAAVAVLLAAALAQAGPLREADFAIRWGEAIDSLPTADPQDPMALYLGAEATSPLADVDLGVLVGAWSPDTEPSLPRLIPDEPIIRTLSAPPPDAPLPAAPLPPARLASFAYPQVTGLGDLGSGGRDVPLGDARYFTPGPGGYGTVLTGRPPGGLENWSHVTRTAISYLRPNVNVQMMLTLEVPGPSAGDAFEGPGLRPEAMLAIERQTKVRSSDIGARTAQFGRPLRPTPVDEPQTAVAAGLDLGLLPTFLSQMGMGVSVVVSRGQRSGNLRIALVGATELPVDWTPVERPYQHPLGLSGPQLVTASPWMYPSGGPGEGRVPGEEPPSPPEEPKTPITPEPPNPPIPEPATLLLLAGGTAILNAWSRRRTG